LWAGGGKDQGARGVPWDDGGEKKKSLPFLLSQRRKWGGKFDVPAKRKHHHP